jgi:hypothetical protein
MKSLDYNKLSDFSLIEEEPRISVFIELNSNASDILRRFKEASRMLDVSKGSEIFECKAELRKLRAEIEGYVVNVWASDRIKSLKEIKEHTGIYHVPARVVQTYYDEEIGFIDDEEVETYVW